jgi:hypothetical protein
MRPGQGTEYGVGRTGKTGNGVLTSSTAFPGHPNTGVGETFRKKDIRKHDCILLIRPGDHCQYSRSKAKAKAKVNKFESPWVRLDRGWVICICRDANDPSCV